MDRDKAPRKAFENARASAIEAAEAILASLRAEKYTGPGWVGVVDMEATARRLCTIEEQIANGEVVS